MQYLITYDKDDTRRSFYSDYFEFETHFADGFQMVVYDLVNHKYIDYRGEWLDIEYNHL